MALGKLNLRVSKEDFEKRIDIIDARMAVLENVVDRYNSAKQNLDQFIENGDSNYEAMCQQIEEYVRNAKKAHAALNATKMELQETIDKMANMGNEVKDTITSATEATVSAVNAAIKIDAIL